MSPIPVQASPPPGGRAWELTATVTRVAGDEGVLYATGNENSGLTVFVQDARLVVDYNAFGDHTIVESDLEVPVGTSTLSVELRRGERPGGTVRLAVDGRPCGEAELGLMMGMVSSVGASVGFDHCSAVSDRYRAPFTFTGELHDVEIVVGRRPDSASDTEAEATARAEMSRQ